MNVNQINCNTNTNNKQNNVAFGAKFCHLEKKFGADFYKQLAQISKRAGLENDIIIMSDNVENIGGSFKAKKLRSIEFNFISPEHSKNNTIDAGVRSLGQAIVVGTKEQPRFKINESSKEGLPLDVYKQYIIERFESFVDLLNH